MLSNFNTRYGGKPGYKVREKTVILEEFGPKSHFRQGEEQYLFFREGDLPPFYCQKSKCKPTDYIGKPKGLKQILWERGLWKDGMTRDGKRTIKGQVIVDKNLSMEEAIIKCRDFKEAVNDSALAQCIRSRGHKCDFTPKYHCECSAIEYCWGRSKVFMKMFCNFNFCDMVKLIPSSLLEDNISLYTIRKCFRMTHDYQL